MKYTEKSFDDLISTGYAYSLVETMTSPQWNVARQLYIKNYLNSRDKEVKIPKKIHQIWLGGELPEKYKKYTESWKIHHPDYEYKLWTDKDVHKFPFTRKDIFDKTVNVGAKSDILRYEILNKFGGIYVDTDFECFKSFDDLMYLDFFTSLSYDTKMQLYIALIACVPEHFIIKETLDSIKIDTSNRAKNIMTATGAYLFTDCFLNVVDKSTKNVVAFPPDYFYPFPNNVRKTGEPYSYLKECSYALHHWEVSWTIK